MDLRQLRYLLAVLDAKSLGGAARALGISQPALTKSMRRLEEELDVRLFRRTPNGMVPTMYAESIRPYAVAATVGMRQSLAEIDSLKDGSSGTVTVTAPPLIGGALLPEAVARLIRARPNLVVRISEQVDDIFTSLAAGKCDVLVATVPAAGLAHGLKQEVLFEDVLVVISRPDHPLAGATRVAPQDLLQHQWIYPVTQNTNRRRLEQIYEAAGVPLPRASIECHAPEMVKAIVRRANYIAWIPKLGVEAELAAGVLHATEIDSPFSVRRIGIFWREYDVSPAAQALIRTIHELCRELGHRGLG